MAFLPLIPAALTLLYGEEPPTKQQGRTACIELTAAFGMLVQVHVLTLEMAVLATGVFCLVNFRRTFSRPVLLTWLKAAASAVLLNLWFLLPFLLCSQAATTAACMSVPMATAARSSKLRA